jgi:hypothetical protein
MAHLALIGLENERTQMDYKWWTAQPVLEVTVEGGIETREEAFDLAQSMVAQIEQSGYKHLIVILDLTSLGQSPSGAALLGGNLPKTYKIEHMVLINAPHLLRLATMPIFKLRNKLHFVTSSDEAYRKTNDLLKRLPK